MSSNSRRPSAYSQQIWNLVARLGMPPATAARHFDTSLRRVERILVGVGRRNAGRWR